MIFENVGFLSFVTVEHLPHLIQLVFADLRCRSNGVHLLWTGFPVDLLLAL